MDFGKTPATQDAAVLIKVPAGLTFSAAAPKGGQGHTWENQYGFIGVSGGTKDGQPSTDPRAYFYCDGLNTAGLSAAALWLTYSDYEQPGPPAQCLDIESLTAYVLGTCATVDEAQERLDALTIWSPEALAVLLPNHLVVHDRHGKSLVLEIIKKKKVYYNNDIGVLTNGPTFDIHAINYYYSYKSLSCEDNTVNKFIEFKPDTKGRNSITIGNGYQYEALGTSMTGLPGDSSSPSRFIRTAKLRECIPATSVLQDSVQWALQILGRAAVCDGEVLIYFNACGEPQEPRNAYDTTVWQLVRSHREQILYFRSRMNHNLFAVDLKTLDFSKGAKATHVSIVQDQWYVDCSAKLQ